MQLGNLKAWYKSGTLYESKLNESKLISNIWCVSFLFKKMYLVQIPTPKKCRAVFFNVKQTTGDIESG